MSLILVTGGTGFLGAHVITQLLNAGHNLRTTIRNLNRHEDLREIIRHGGADPTELMIVEADLEEDSGWADAVKDADYVLHIASPFPTGKTANAEDVIRPARNGMLRVLRPARAAGVKRVVMTSSFAAIGYGHPPQRAPFTEESWSNPDAPDVQPYIKSKILAEKAAWDFVEKAGGSPELSVINPTGIFGPVLGPDYSSSIRLIKGLLDGQMPFVPRLYFGVVDVRDVAEPHIRAMTSPSAAGERFIAVSGEPISMHAVASLIRRQFGDAAGKVPQI